MNDHLNFISYIRSIQIDKHVLMGRRGVEENVKVKVIIPLLQNLGWDLLNDMNFEYMGADIVLYHNEKPLIIVETKSWGEIITNYLDQCLDYTLKLKTPWVIITSGQYTSLYCSLLNTDDLFSVEPIIKFSFDELAGENGQLIFEKLSSLIGKENFVKNDNQIDAIVSKSLGTRSIEEAQADFLQKSKNFKGDVSTRMLTEDDFFLRSSGNSGKVHDALICIYKKMLELTSLNNNLKVRYRSKEIGIEYHMNSHPRNRKIGLFGIYPESASIAYGLEGWIELNISKSTFNKLDKYPRKAQSIEWAEKLASLLRKAIGEINDKSNIVDPKVKTVFCSS